MSHAANASMRAGDFALGDCALSTEPTTFRSHLGSRYDEPAVHHAAAARDNSERRRHRPAYGRAVLNIVALFAQHTDLFQQAQEVVEEILFHDLAPLVPVRNDAEVDVEFLFVGLTTVPSGIVIAPFMVPVNRQPCRSSRFAPA